jgi:uncharacterized protein
MDHSAHLAASMPGATASGVIAALFVAGLVGSFSHCAAMCGPFVLAQVSSASGAPPFLRLVRGALIPYHLGRATTYAFLGAIAGSIGHGIAATIALRPVLAGFLLVAAALFLIQALIGLGLLPPLVRGFSLTGRAGTALARLAGPLLRRDDGTGSYVLGVTLGFLPCGLLYGALAAAAGTGSALGGAMAMAAFTAATAPSLVAIGCARVGLAQRWRRLAQAAMPPLQLFNAVVLAGLALGGPAWG